MSHSGGKPVFEWQVALDTLVNIGTYGLVGYDANKGSFKQGVATHAVDETIGEITGRILHRRNGSWPQLVWREDHSKPRRLARS